MKPKTVGRAMAGHSPLARSLQRNVGMRAGTLVRSADGEVPVQYLSQGDRIATRNAGLVPLRGIRLVRQVLPAVSVEAGALGQDCPAVSVIIPACQPILLRGAWAQTLSGQAQAVTPVGFLADGGCVTELGERSMTLVQLFFDAPYVIYADGLELSIPAQEISAAA